MFLLFLTSHCQSLPTTASHCRPLPIIVSPCHDPRRAQDTITYTVAVQCHMGFVRIALAFCYGTVVALIVSIIKRPGQSRSKSSHHQSDSETAQYLHFTACSFASV